MTTTIIIIVLTIISSSGLADVETAIRVFEALRAVIQISGLTNATQHPYNKFIRQTLSTRHLRVLRVYHIYCTLSSYQYHIL